MRRYLALSALQAAAGLACEALAWWLGWWQFRSSAWIAVQVVGFWGLVMGAVTLAVHCRHPALRYLAGAAVGGGAELLNHAALGLWAFPQERVWGLGVPWPGLLALALAWGLVPLLAAPATEFLGLAPRRS